MSTGQKYYELEAAHPLAFTFQNRWIAEPPRVALIFLLCR